MRKFGNTGMEIKRVGFGGIPIQRISQEDTNKVIDELEKCGVNFIDTARGYTISEEYLGNALKGKHSKYLAYENMIAGYINQQYQGEQIEEDLITVLKLYFPDKRMGDLHNYPKSICDGIEKSGIIKNDKQLKPVLLFNYIDKEEPRVEIFLYPVSKYDVSYTITEK